MGPKRKRMEKEPSTGELPAPVYVEFSPRGYTRSSAVIMRPTNSSSDPISNAGVTSGESKSQEGAENTNNANLRAGSGSSRGPIMQLPKKTKNMVQKQDRNKIIIKKVSILLCRFSSSAETFVRSILEFNSTVWGPGLTKDQTDSIEKIQRRAMSTILNLKVTERSYHDHLLVLGLDTLKKRREAALSRMGASILQNPRLRNMLPDFCNVTSARSLRQSNLLMPITTTRKRYQNSSIPAMVNLINAEFRQTKSFRGIQYVSHFTD
ncbi:hypothetical protein Fcan01_22333 [Folsomia candida]|uniref:Uncharacterized protein n=2 Tax=Folsomia candida TaxID=158441 RepID=A0A226DDI1_FOLCA|nr:hypothetical protein Fcan01_22333 [Folsomia candida]